MLYDPDPKGMWKTTTAFNFLDQVFPHSVLRPISELSIFFLNETFQIKTRKLVISCDDMHYVLSPLLMRMLFIITLAQAHNWGTSCSLHWYNMLITCMRYTSLHKVKCQTLPSWRYALSSERNKWALHSFEKIFRHCLNNEADLDCTRRIW